MGISKWKVNNLCVILNIRLSTSMHPSNIIKISWAVLNFFKGPNCTTGRVIDHYHYIFPDCKILGVYNKTLSKINQFPFQVVDHFAVDNTLTVNMYCAMFLVPLLTFTQIKNLKNLAPASGFANLLLFATFLICLYYICIDFPDLTALPKSVDIGQLPLFIG